MNQAFRPENTRYTPSFKTKKKTNKTNLLTVNTEGNRYMCVLAPRTNLTKNSIEQLVFDPSTIESYIRFIHDRILNADDDDFARKLEAYGYGDCAVYTWILKSNDREKKKIEDVEIDTPVSLYMTKVVSPQEIGSLHRDLDQLHPRELSETMPVIGAGELKVLGPTEIEFNLLSGTYMADKILKKKLKANQSIIENKIIALFSAKLEEKGFDVTFNENYDLVEGTCFITPKENMNLLHTFFKKRNTRKNKNRGASTKATGLEAAGAGAGTGTS